MNTESQSTRLRQLEHQFCEAIDLHVEPDTFDGGNCNECIVGQIGYAIGAFRKGVAKGGEGGDIRYYGSPNGLRATDASIPRALAVYMARGKGLTEDEFDQFLLKVIDIYDEVAFMDYDKAVEYARKVMECLS